VLLYFEKLVCQTCFHPLLSAKKLTAHRMTLLASHPFSPSHLSWPLHVFAIESIVVAVFGSNFTVIGTTGFRVAFLPSD